MCFAGLVAALSRYSRGPRRVTPPPTGGYRPADQRNLVPDPVRCDRAVVLFSHSAGVDPTGAGWACGGWASRVEA
jgi:hypothetical protein